MFKKLKSQVQEAVNQLSPQAAAAASNFLDMWKQKRIISKKDNS